MKSLSYSHLLPLLFFLPALACYPLIFYSLLYILFQTIECYTTRNSKKYQLEAHRSHASRTYRLPPPLLSLPSFSLFKFLIRKTFSYIWRDVGIWEYPRRTSLWPLICSRRKTSLKSSRTLSLLLVSPKPFQNIFSYLIFILSLFFFFFFDDRKV